MLNKLSAIASEFIQSLSASCAQLMSISVAISLSVALAMVVAILPTLVIYVLYWALGVAGIHSTSLSFVAIYFVILGILLVLTAFNFIAPRDSESAPEEVDDEEYTDIATMSLGEVLEHIESNFKGSNEIRYKGVNLNFKLQEDEDGRILSIEGDKEAFSILVLAVHKSISDGQGVTMTDEDSDTDIVLTIVNDGESLMVS